MAGMETSVTIGRPIGVVFAFFLNPKESAPQMSTREALITMVPEGPPGPGTTFIFQQKMFGRAMTTTTHLTAVDPDRTIEFDAGIGPLRPHCSLSFEDSGGQTHVTFRGDSNPPAALKMITGLTNRMGQRNWSQRLDSAKRTLESPTRPG